jgi:hypothetical protein
MLELGALVAIVADHGMNDNTPDRGNLDRDDRVVISR